MRILLNRLSPLATSCQHWLAVSPTSPAEGPPDAVVDQYRGEIRIRPNEPPSAAFNRIQKLLFTYDIFPRRLIQYALCPPGAITKDTTIVQQVMLGPVALEMAVRVIEVWNREHEGVHEAGFTYVTLQGHAECGVASFGVRLDEEQGGVVLIDARSRPGTLLTRIARPAAQLFQRDITIAALRRLKGA